MNPPCRNPTDADKYRQQYMSNLSLQAANDQKNLNANLIFKQTGQTPSQPTDFRTITEKAADIDGLRREVRSYIASIGITNTTEANEIAQTLAPQELTFFIQYKLFISTDFKGRGVPADVFIAYLRKLIRKTAETQNVNYGLQQSTGEAILMSSQQILGALPNEQDYTRLGMALTAIRQQIARSGAAGERGQDRTEFFLEQIAEEIAAMRAAMPTAQDFQEMGALPPAYRQEIQVLFDRAFRDLPTKADLQQIERNIGVALASDDTPRIRQILRDLRDLLELSKFQEAELVEIKSLIARASVQLKEEKAEEEGATPAEAIAYYGGGGSASASAPLTPSRRIAEAEPLTPKEGNKKSAEEARKEEHIGLGTWDHYLKAGKAAFLIKKKSQGQFTTTLTDTQIGKKNVAGLDALHLEYLEQKRQGGHGGGEARGHGLRGCGLKKGRPTYSKRNYIENQLIDGVLVKPKPYVPFGRFVVNKFKLDDKVLMLRRKSGGSLKELPTHSISSNLASVLKAICGGVSPHPDTIMGLGLKDQEHLHHIVKLSQIENIQIPTPRNKDDAKQNERFDILKGEIMAGNDNKTLVREFKVLLLRLIQQGRIPRREGQEILIDLTAMGF
jgi:hypothetical protein